MIKILLVDDHKVVREGLKMLLSETGDIVISDEADSGQAAIDKIIGNSFDMILLDISLPDISGYQVLTQIRSAGSTTPVLVLSRHPEDQYAGRALKVGASGYMSKDCAGDDLIEAIRVVARGELFLSPKVVSKLVGNIQGTSSFLPHELLSDREFEVMRLLAKGQPASEIAKQLSLSVNTINTHRLRILKKMDLSNTVDLIRYGIEQDIVD